MEELIVGYKSGDLDSVDVKLALQKAINDILEVTIALLLDYKQQQQSLLVHAAVG